MSRLPTEAASRNMSACSAQAMSQVGCRLMVASSANTSRPRAPAACGDIARALATKAAMSSELDARPSGSEPGLREGTSLWESGLVGSPAMRARWVGCTLYVGREFGAVNARASALTRDDRGVVSSASSVREGLGGFFLLRSVERHRAGLGNDLGRCLQRVDRRNPGVGRVEELVEHALDRGLRRI